MLLNYTISDIMKAYSEDAVELGKQMGKDLDFSEDSLLIIEEILELYHSSLPKRKILKWIKQKPSEEKVVQVSKIWGGYLGEAIRKNLGGEWLLEDNTIILALNDTLIFPPAKVYKRITIGNEDNIWHYYQTLKQNLR